MATTPVMYHLAPAHLRERILQEGLRCGMSGGFTVDAIWADEVYGCRPVFLSLEPGRSADTRYELAGRDVWQVDTAGLELVADLPGLYDSGASVEPGEGMWFHEGYTPDALAPFEDDDGLIGFDDLTDACAAAAIAVTLTAACLSDIAPCRLSFEQVIQDQAA